MKSYIKIVKAMFSGNKRVLAEAFSVMVILLALEMTIPVCVNKMIDSLAVENGIVTFLGGIFLFACAYGSVCFLSALNTKLYIRIGNQLLWNMREQIYKVLWYSGYMENVQKKKDKFKFVLSNQAYTAFAIAVIYSIGGFTNLLSMIAFLVIVFLYSVPVGMTLIICIFVTLVVSFFTGKKILEGYETCNVMQEKDTSQIYETVDMVEVTRSNGLEDYYLKKNKMIHDNFLHLLETAESRSAFCETVESSLHSLIYIVVAGVLLLSTNFNGGTLVTILFLTNLLLEVSQRVQRQLQVIIKNIPVFDNVVELMEIPLESGRKLEKVENITFENVSFQIEERSIFKNLNFSVQEGQNILIQGENGSGKSSLLNLLVGIVKYKKGSILFEGREFKKLKDRELLQEIGIVFQNPQNQFITYKVIDELLFTLNRVYKNQSEKNIERAENLLREFNLYEYKNFSPYSLSQGQQRKLAVLSMLCGNQKVLLCDEPTYGQDNKTSREIMEFLSKKSKEGLSIILVSHDINLVVEYSDCIYEFKDKEMRRVEYI